MTGHSLVTMLIWKGVVWLASLAMAGLSAVLSFAAGGFGILTALAWLHSVGMGAVKITTWLAALAMAAYTAWTGPATIGTTLLTAGLNLLVAALGLTVIAIGAVLLASPIAIVAAWGFLVYKILEATGGLDTLSRTGSAAATRLTSSWGNVSSTLVGTTRSIASGFSTMFSGLVGDSISAFRGVQDAFSVGNWRLIWEIASAYAQIAWARIYAFGEAAWIELKYAWQTIWGEVTAFFVDSFRDAWSALRVLFTQGLAFAESGFWALAASILQSFETVRVGLVAILTGLAAIGAPGARLALAGLGAVSLQTSINTATGRSTDATSRGNDRQREIERQNATAQRDALFALADRQRQLEIERAAGLEDAAARSAAEIARLQENLGRLTDAARRAREERDASRDAGQGRGVFAAGLGALGDLGRGSGSFDATAGRSANYGTFSASAASGYAGGAPMDRLQRTSEEQLAVAQQIRDILQNGGGAIG
jgi:hypothetical protein